MNDLVLTNNLFDADGYWTRPVDKITYFPIPHDLDLFDQNGYDLTELEQYFAYSNLGYAEAHRYRRAIKKPWFTQEEKNCYSVLNHSLLFERKGYAGAAKEQLEFWSKKNPLVHKLLALRPKWGLDFSMDWVDNDGNAFEVFHWEYDGFDYEEIQVRKLQVQAKIATTDWDDAGRQMLKHKDQWHHLDFFEQSAWKCKYFGIINERFKMVAWE